MFDESHIMGTDSCKTKANSTWNIRFYIYRTSLLDLIVFTTSTVAKRIILYKF